MSLEDGHVFQRLFGPSEPVHPLSEARSASETAQPISTLPPRFWFEGLDGEGRAQIAQETVDVDAMLRAIDKLEVCIARLKRFLMVDQ